MELYRIPNGCLSAFGRVEVYRIPTEIYLSQLSLIHTISINNSVVFQLQRIPILNHLSYELLIKLVRTSVVKSVRAGEVIYRRGDPPDHFYIILSCAIVSYNVSREENKSRIAGFLYPGDYFGEGTILNNNPRRATVTILNSGILLEVTREQFTEYLKGCREALKENYLSKSFRYEMSEKNVVPIQLICKNKVADMRIVQYTLTGELYSSFLDNNEDIDTSKRRFL